MSETAVDVEGSSEPLKVPALFKANIFSGSCETKDGDEVVFPNPGDSVEYGNTRAGGKGGETKAPGCSDEQTGANQFVTLSSNGAGGSSTKGDSSAQSSEKASTQSSGSASASIADFVAPAEPTPDVPINAKVQAPSAPSSSIVSAPPADPAPSNSPATPSGSCKGGAYQCSDDGKSFSVCSEGTWVPMGRKIYLSLTLATELNAAFRTQARLRTVWHALTGPSQLQEARLLLPGIAVSDAMPEKISTLEGWRPAIAASVGRRLASKGLLC